MSNENNPAMPVMDESEIHGQHYGLTKLEYAAIHTPVHDDVLAQYMEGMGFNPEASTFGDYCKCVAEIKVMKARALFKELSNENE